MFMVALTTHWKVGTFRTSKRINLGLSRFQRDSWNVLNHIELLKQELDDLNGSWRVSPIEKTQKNSKQPRHKRVIVTSKNTAVMAGRDVEQIVSFWADDAIVIPPGQAAIIGKDAIRNYVTASLKIPGFNMQWKTTRFTVARAGDLAYGVGTNQVSFNDENGNRVTSRGKAVTIWRMESARAWKCVVDIWNDDAPLSNIS
ncbi:DUF4440 domain-containing protein [Candidatus Bathyarchaeota archaeon]|nr:MAG: DUF4440 domain-containing protein [Candidatus Bathyarchaeota archaeon]